MDEKVMQKLDELVKTNAEQNVVLAELKVLTNMNNEMLKKHDKKLDNVSEDTARNTTDLAHHIKRTDILQSRQYKLIILTALALGAAAVYFGPTALKFLGFLI